MCPYCHTVLSADPAAHDCHAMQRADLGRMASVGAQAARNAKRRKGSGRGFAHDEEGLVIAIGTARRECCLQGHKGCVGHVVALAVGEREDGSLVTRPMKVSPCDAFKCSQCARDHSKVQGRHDYKLVGRKTLPTYGETAAAAQRGPAFYRIFCRVHGLQYPE